MNQDLDHCPLCGSPVTVRPDGTRSCGFVLDDGTAWGCEWEEPPLLDLAPKP
jgi:hypothetical protein